MLTKNSSCYNVVGTTTVLDEISLLMAGTTLLFSVVKLNNCSDNCKQWYLTANDREQ